MHMHMHMHVHMHMHMHMRMHMTNMSTCTCQHAHVNMHMSHGTWTWTWTWDMDMDMVICGGCAWREDGYGCAPLPVVRAWRDGRPLGGRELPRCGGDVLRQGDHPGLRACTLSAAPTPTLGPTLAPTLAPSPAPAPTLAPTLTLATKFTLSQTRCRVCCAQTVHGAVHALCTRCARTVPIAGAPYWPHGHRTLA